MDTALSDFPSETPSTQEHIRGGSVVSCITDVSRSEPLPLSAQGYFSNPHHFSYFAECADSWFKVRPGSRLGPENEQYLRLLFESASHLGLFGGTALRLTWKQKLWAIGAHYGIDQEPWLFDEFTDAPEALDLYRMSRRLRQDVHALQEAQASAGSLVVSDFVRPTAERHPSPYQDPYPAENISNLTQELAQAQENILRGVDDILRRQGPNATSPLVPYQSSQEDPTPEALESPRLKSSQGECVPSPLKGGAGAQVPRKRAPLEQKLARELVEAREELEQQALRREQEASQELAELAAKLRRESTLKEQEVARLLAQRKEALDSAVDEFQLDAERSISRAKMLLHEQEAQAELVMRQAQASQLAHEDQIRLMTQLAQEAKLKHETETQLLIQQSQETQNLIQQVRLNQEAQVQLITQQTQEAELMIRQSTQEVKHAHEAQLEALRLKTQEEIERIRMNVRQHSSRE
jgi:hypothetical protein